MNDSHMRFLESNSQYIRYSMTDFLKVQKELESHHIDLVLQSPHIYVDCEEYGQIRKYQKDFERYQICVDCVTPFALSLQYRISSQQSDRTTKSTILCKLYSRSASLR